MDDRDLTGAFWICRGCRTPNPRAGYLTTCLGCGTPRPADPPGHRRRPRSSPWSWSMPRWVSGRTAWGWLGAACWAYVGSILGLCVILRLMGDRWWFATLLLFGPRWIWAVPLALLMPVASARRRTALGPLAVALLLIVFPLMGFRVSWR